MWWIIGILNVDLDGERCVVRNFHSFIVIWDMIHFKVLNFFSSTVLNVPTTENQPNGVFFYNVSKSKGDLEKSIKPESDLINFLTSPTVKIVKTITKGIIRKIEKRQIVFLYFAKLNHVQSSCEKKFTRKCLGISHELIFHLVHEVFCWREGVVLIKIEK